MTETRDEYAQRHHDQAMDMVARVRRAQEAVNALGAGPREEDSERLAGARIIGVGGYKESGKDAFADFLVEDSGFVKTFMSEALNRALLALDPWIPTDRVHGESGGWRIPAGLRRYSELYSILGYTEVKKNPEVRRLLQMLGTEVGRDMLGEHTWVDACARRVRELIGQGHHRVVITGIRFRNELDMISRMGGQSVWVDRPEALAAYRREDSGHRSENTLRAKDFDFRIHNDGTLDDLRRLTTEFAAHITR